jgi:hypothetical protein
MATNEFWKYKTSSETSFKNLSLWDEKYNKNLFINIWLPKDWSFEDSFDVYIHRVQYTTFLTSFLYSQGGRKGKREKNDVEDSHGFHDLGAI